MPSNTTPPERGLPTRRLAAEIAAVDEAKKVLASGDASATLRLLDQYDAAYPSGVLGPESAALRIEALASSGRGDEARARLHAFEARYPESPLLERLERLENGP